MSHLTTSESVRNAISADVLERIKKNIDRIGEPGDIRELDVDKELHGLSHDVDTNRFYLLCNALVRIWSEKEDEDETQEAHSFYQFLDYYPEKFTDIIGEHFGKQWREVAAMLFEYDFI